MQTINPQPKPEAWRSEDYKSFVRGHYCCNCMMPKTYAHHVRTASNSGTGIKPDDLYCIPLCFDCHDLIHKKGTKTFMKLTGVDIYNVLFELTKEWIKNEK